MAAHPRPLSPHLQVYRQPLTAGAMSILHRITGAILAVASLALAWWLLAAAGGGAAFARFTGFAGSWLGVALLTVGAGALVYHLLNGVRHLLWDIGWGYELPRAAASGKAVLVLTVVPTLVLVYAGLRAAGAA